MPPPQSRGARSRRWSSSTRASRASARSTTGCGPSSPSTASPRGRSPRRPDAMIAAGHRLGPLHGVPIAIKDNIAVAGQPTTAGSKILADWVPDEDATVAARLKGQGAIVIGKTQPARVRLGRHLGEPALRRSCATRGTRSASRRGRAAGPARRSPRARATARSAPTPAARSGCRRRSTASSASGRRSAGSATTA